MVIFNSKERKLNEGELKPIFEYLNYIWILVHIFILLNLYL
jgi:hypothetical protein